MTAPDESVADPVLRARNTVARVRAALEAGQSASIAQIVELIREVTCKFETISVQGLGEVIGRDLLTMSRVISVAHTLGYNPEGVEISTINQAIHVIGFNKIRNLALSLMLMEHAASGPASEKRNVAAFALVGGLVAQAVRQRQRPADAEEAFVCAALRNYGRIMLANFLPDEYARALAAGPAREAAAFREEFGLTPLELSAALLEQTRMPRNIMLGLRELTDSERSSGQLSPEMALAVVADFAEELCRLAGEPLIESTAFADRAMQLVRRYGPNVGLTEEELFAVLEDTAGTLNMFGALQPGHALNSRLLQRLRTLAFRVAVIPSEAAELRSIAGAPAPTHRPQSDDVAGELHRRDALAAGVAALQELEVRPDATLERAYAIALAAIHEGLGLAHTLLFRRGAGGQRYVAWQGAGDFFALVNGEELLDATVRDVFSVCLRRGEDVLIQNPADPKIVAFIPEWLRPAAGAQPLLLWPVRDRQGTVTLFCGLRGDTAKFTLTVRQAQLLHALRLRLAGLENRLNLAPGTADARATAPASAA